MTEFLLLAARVGAPSNISPAETGRNLAALAEWRGLLGRWGLLRAYGVPADATAQPRACLLVRASGTAAATRLARAWGRLGGYDVTVLALTAAAPLSGARC